MTALTTIPLITNGTATGAAQPWQGGSGVLSAVGTFNGATIALQFLLPDGATWFTTAASLTAAGTAAFSLPAGQIRALVTGGPPAAMYVNAGVIPTTVC
jgi:hypothetical protein